MFCLSLLPYLDELLAARVGVRMLHDLGAGKDRQRCGAGKVAVKEQQGRRLKQENGEGETERYDMHNATNTFS